MRLDHLNSSSLDLSNTGLVLQVVDYLPFGKTNTYKVTSKRIKGKKGGYIIFRNYGIKNFQVSKVFDRKLISTSLGTK